MDWRNVFFFFIIVISLIIFLVNVYQPALNELTFDNGRSGIGKTAITVCGKASFPAGDKPISYVLPSDCVELLKNFTPTKIDEVARKQQFQRLMAEYYHRFKKDERALRGFHYCNNIFSKLNTNDYAVSDQLIRLITASDDVKRLFCAFARNETTVTMKRGILLINNQLNIDGQTFSAYTNAGSSDVGRRMQNVRSKKHGKTYFNSGILLEDVLGATKFKDGQNTNLSEERLRNVLSEMKKLWMSEDEVNEFKTHFLFFNDNGITFNGTVDKLTVSDFHRLIQIHQNTDKLMVEKWKAVDKLGIILRCVKVYMFAGCMERINYELYSSFNKQANVPKKLVHELKEKHLSSLMDGFQNIITGEQSVNDQNANVVVEDIKKNTDELTKMYQTNNTFKRFKEHAAVEGPRAAAFEAYGHGLKKFNKCKANTSFEKFLHAYLKEDVSDTAILSQDGRIWKTTNEEALKTLLPRCSFRYSSEEPVRAGESVNKTKKEAPTRCTTMYLSSFHKLRYTILR